MPYVAQFAATHRIVMSPIMSDPVMFYAFYSRLDPQVYQQTVVLGPREATGWQHAVKVDSFEVANLTLPEVACQALVQQQPTLYVTDHEYDPHFLPLQEFRSMNGVHAYALVYDALTFAQESQLKCQPEAEESAP